MKTGIMTFAIVIVLMATVQTAMAGEQFTARGLVQYENGTTFPYGATGQMWNLNHSEYAGQPWTFTTQLCMPPWDPVDYAKSGEYGSEDDFIKVSVTSPDGTYVGVNISRWGDVRDQGLTQTRMNVTMYEVTVEPDTFTKSLPIGWNLISLPLTPLDSSTSAVLGNDTIAYDVVYRYDADATSKQFVDVTTATMDPGTGYFVHVTTAGDWTYEGTPETSTSPGLKTGLNMIGVPNCTMSVDAAMGTADYRYVARWDAADQKFEVYNPSAPVEFQHFNTMEPGEGYFVSAKSDYALKISC